MEIKMKTLTMKQTTHNGYQVVLKQDVNTEYESVLFVDFYPTKKRAENAVKKLEKQFM
jgi:hypothetical protein|tara:strand:+ start:293 stop:466 length:174 start_codon:yes stop_codon:yes gene_type:complete